MLHFAHIESALLRLPVVDRSVADPMLPAKIRRLHSGLMLLQDRNDLLFRVPALLHPSPPVQITRELQFSLVEFSGGRSCGANVTVQDMGHKSVQAKRGGQNEMCASRHRIQDYRALAGAPDGFGLGNKPENQHLK